VSRRSEVSRASGRLLLGRKLRSTEMARGTLRKRVAVPIFGSDAISSNAYSPDEILLTLAAAGVAAYAFSVPVALAVVVVLLVVSASYRLTVYAYPSGDYEATRANLGPGAGTVVGGAMLVDYVLVLAVSLASAAQFLATAAPVLQGQETWLAVGGLVLLLAVNLRGVRRWRPWVAWISYAFVAAVGVVVLLGLARALTGSPPVATSADLEVVPDPAVGSAVTAVALGLLVLRALSVGSVTLTGVQTLVSATPYFRAPKGRNVGTSLMVLAVLGSLLLLGVVGLSRISGVTYVADPATQLLDDGQPVGPDYDQAPVLGQLARAVFDDASVAFVIVELTAVAVLVLAAHVAFTSFPVLGSLLARDGYLPRAMYTRSDRLAFSTGILTLGLVAAVLLVVTRASVTQLVQMYVVGVFVAFVLSQAGMLRHWRRELTTEHRTMQRRRLVGSRAVTLLGLVLSAGVLVVVLASKLLLGAWVAVVMMAIVVAAMTGIRRHYDAVGQAVATDVALTRVTLPSRVHALVLVAHVNRSSLRAVTYARAANPDVLEGVTVDVDSRSTRRLMDDWDAYDVPIPLRVLDSPYREITRPVLEYVRGIQRASPRDVVAVFVPEYVPTQWWERALHNTSTAKVVEQLARMRGVMITRVPWQVSEPDAADFREEPVVRRADPR
jgi:amino acid transporter